MCCVYWVRAAYATAAASVCGKQTVSGGETIADCEIRCSVPVGRISHQRHSNDVRFRHPTMAAAAVFWAQHVLVRKTRPQRLPVNNTSYSTISAIGSRFPMLADRRSAIIVTKYYVRWISDKIVFHTRARSLIILYTFVPTYIMYGRRRRVKDALSKCCTPTAAYEIPSPRHS